MPRIFLTLIFTIISVPTFAQNRGAVHYHHHHYHHHHYSPYGTGIGPFVGGAIVGGILGGSMLPPPVVFAPRPVCWTGYYDQYGHKLLGYCN